MKNYKAAPDLLKGRVVLVTGAGQGIGRIAALTYAAHGATVVLHGRKVKKLEKVYDEIEVAKGPQPAIIPLDLEKAEEKDFEGLAGAVETQLGRLDGILHNAAFGYTPSPLESQTLEQWLAWTRVDLLAPFALTRACLPLLKKSPDASVLMTSETHGHSPAAYWGGLAVVKSGIETLVKVASQEWEMYGNLRMNAVIPGPVQSPQRTRTHPGEAKSNLPRPEDLMPVYLYLMGPDSKGVSGQIIDCQSAA
ncbi:MAG: YciK family oxidoreductase [Betaproteobacteria bacterium]|nr:YciK family oxidoreductase [Betaproteobacteria bacterium]